MEPEEILMELEEYLPDNIRVVDAEEDEDGTLKVTVDASPPIAWPGCVEEGSPATARLPPFDFSFATAGLEARLAWVLDDVGGAYCGRPLLELVVSKTPRELGYREVAKIIAYMIEALSLLSPVWRMAVGEEEPLDA